MSGVDPGTDCTGKRMNKEEHSISSIFYYFRIRKTLRYGKKITKIYLVPDPGDILNLIAGCSFFETGFEYRSCHLCFIAFPLPGQEENHFNIVPVITISRCSGMDQDFNDVY